MRPQAAVLLLLAAGTAAHECSARADGYHWDAACAAYWLCKAGRTVLSRSCSEGTLFNGLMCVPAALVQCRPQPHRTDDRPCQGLRDGFHRDYIKGGCSSFMVCEGGQVARRGECPPLTSFDGLSCVGQKEATCGHNSIEDVPPCPAASPGVFSTQSCRGYFYCSEAGVRSQVYECPSGQVFNSTLQQCVGGSSCSAPLLGTCHNKTDGYYQDALSSGCRSYLYCFQGRSITYLCPEGYAFNGTSCLVDTSFECPYWSADCEAKADGYHADASSGCRQYFFCLDGQRVRTLTCSDNRLFDGSKCAHRASCAARASQATPPPGAECDGAADGRHLVRGSGCARFVACLGGRKAATGSCAAGFRFVDGECRQGAACPAE